MGLDDTKTRLLCLQSASDVEDALCLPRAMLRYAKIVGLFWLYIGPLLTLLDLLRTYPNVTLTNKMLDAHLYIFSRWVLDLIEVQKDFCDDETLFMMM